MLYLDHSVYSNPKMIYCNVNKKMYQEKDLGCLPVVDLSETNDFELNIF